MSSPLLNSDGNVVVTGIYSRSPSALRIVLVVSLLPILLGLITACSSFPMCNLHLEDGRLVLDQCAGQDQKPPEDGSDEKPATYDPEKPPG